MKYTWSWTNIAAIRIPPDNPRRIMTFRQIPSSSSDFNPHTNLAHSFCLKVCCFKVTLRGAKQRWHTQGAPVYLSPSCWSPKTPPMKMRVNRVTPSAHGSRIASFVRSAHLSRNSIQHWWYNRYLRADVESNPWDGRLSLLSSYTGIQPTGIQFLGLHRSSSCKLSKHTAK